MNFPSNSNSKTTFKNTLLQPPQAQQRHQNHQDNSHQALPANSAIFNNKEINQQYESFLKKREETKLKISQAFQICDKELQATELRRLIFQKPTLQEALNLNSFIDNTLFSLHKEEIQDDIEQSKRCFKKVQDIFISNQAHLSDWKASVNLREISHSIASAWDQISQLPFYDPCFIQEICEFEWVFRAREVLSHERTDSKYPYVDLCKDLQKGAGESQSEKIKGSIFYKRLEEELARYQRLMEKVKGTQGQAHEIQGLLQELKEFGFGMKEEIESVEKILQKFTSKKAVEQNHDKNSIVQVKLEDFMDSVLQDISRFDETRDSSQKSQEEKLRSEVARSILIANKELLGRLAIDMTASQPNGEMQRISAFVEEQIRDLQEHPPKFEDICAWSQAIQEFKLYAKELEQIKVEMCLSKVKFIQVFCETFDKPSKSIPLQDLSKLLVEIKGYHLKGFLESPKKEILKEHMMYLKDLIKKVKGQIHTEVGLQRENEWRPPNIMFYNFIDISDEIDHLKKEFENKKKINQKILQNNHIEHIESLNKKRSSTSSPEEQEEEINSFNLLAKKIKGENNYKTVNRSGESIDTAEIQKGSEKSVNILVEEIVGDVRKRDKRIIEKRNGREEDEFVIKKKGTKKYLNNGGEANFEQSDSSTETRKELDNINILVEKIISDARKQERNSQKGTDSRKEDEFVIKKKGIKKYLNEGCGDSFQNFEKSDSPTETRKELDNINILVEEIIGDTRRRDNNNKKIIERKEEDFVIKKKGTKKYLNEGSLANVEQRDDSPVRQYDLDKINDFLLQIDDGFKLKKKNKNETRVDSKDGISKIN